MRLLKCETLSTLVLTNTTNYVHCAVVLSCENIEELVCDWRYYQALKIVFLAPYVDVMSR